MEGIDTESLKGTIWSMMYQTFNVHRDNQLCEWMSNIGLAYTALVGTYSLIQPAPYGRYGSPKFGPTISPKLAWVVQESPAFVVPVLLVLSTPSEQLRNPENVIALSLFLIHYFHRSFIFPFALSPLSKPTPIAATFSAVLFCAYNGFLQGHHLANTFEIERCLLAELVGLPLFFIGMGINVVHDRMLIALKSETNKNASGEAEYKIPQGYLFEYISGANYFGEILEWWSLALFTRGLPQVTFAIFASTFLGIRAFHHHSWYKEKFGTSYPSGRKAVIPFLL